MRVPRTFLFVDLTGFTNYTAENGDNAAGEILSNFRTITRQVASDNGVRIAKWLGDGAMLVALAQGDGVAVALEIEQRAAAECAPLALRAGIASGKALLFEGDDYIGSAGNMASRLCDVARAHEVLIPTDQVDDLPEGVSATDYGVLSLQGFPEPIEVVELSGTAVGRADDVGEIWTRTPFAG